MRGPIVSIIEFLIAGRHFSMPEGYRPHKYSDGGGSPVRYALVFNGPDFDAYGPSENANWQYHYDIIITAENAVDLSSVLKRQIALYEKVDIEPEFNLSRIQQHRFEEISKERTLRRARRRWNGNRIDQL
jgi:hypothetical protein